MRADLAKERTNMSVTISKIKNKYFLQMKLKEEETDQNLRGPKTKLG